MCGGLVGRAVWRNKHTSQCVKTDRPTIGFRDKAGLGVGLRQGGVAEKSRERPRS